MRPIAKQSNKKEAFTLIEMLIVVAVIAVLVTIVASTATHIDNQAKAQLTESTIGILTAALGQFRDYEYQYKHTNYADFDFPLDCNDFDNIGLADTVQNALGLLAGSVSISGGVHDLSYSGSEALYFFLSRVPECRSTLDKIDGSLITNEGSDKQPMSITVDTRSYPLLRIIDPWGETLRYDYYNEDVLDPVLRSKTKRNFPVITSAGPDKTFNTGDDITSR